MILMVIKLAYKYPAMLGNFRGIISLNGVLELILVKILGFLALGKLFAKAQFVIKIPKPQL